MSRPLRRFCFKLAVALHKDVREVLGWPSSLISEWMAYDQMEPFPDSWWQMGMLATIMCGAWGGKKTRPEDFIPRVRTRRRRQTEQEQWVILGGAIAAAEAQKRR